LSVSNLSRNVNEDHLREIFGNYGKVRDAALAIDRVVGLPKGYAYVQYASEYDAERAIAHFHGGQIDGNIIKVEFQSDRRLRAKAERRAAENGDEGKEPPRKADAKRSRERGAAHRNGEYNERASGKSGNKLQRHNECQVKDRNAVKKEESRRRDRRDEGKKPKESDKRPREKESKANAAKDKGKGREKEDRCSKATSERPKSKKSKPTSPPKKSNGRKNSTKQVTKAGSAKRDKKMAGKEKASSNTRGGSAKARASSSSSASSSSGASSSDSSKASSQSSSSSSLRRTTKRRRR